MSKPAKKGPASRSPSRRRGFEIDMPEDRPAPRATLVGEPRRGPMAAAITEASVAQDERRAAEDAIRAENDALAAAQVQAKRLGLAAELIPLEAISSTKLIRDRRVAAVDYDIAELKASLLEIGLSNPIRVEPAGDGAYELIQGLRRLTAYRALYEETGDKAWAAIPALMTQPGESIEGLYRRMVDENLVRKDVSFAEMAMLAAAYAADPETGETDVEEAVKLLFKSASYQKRSYIRGFAELMGFLDKNLAFPEEIPRNLGISLRDRIRETPGLVGALQTALKALGANRSVQDELAVLRAHATAGTETGTEGASEGASGRTGAAQGAAARVALSRPLGEAVCTAGKGKLSLKAPEDFTVYSPAALTRALQAFYDALD